MLKRVVRHGLRLRSLNEKDILQIIEVNPLHLERRGSFVPGQEAALHLRFKARMLERKEAREGEEKVGGVFVSLRSSHCFMEKSSARGRLRLHN